MSLCSHLQLLQFSSSLPDKEEKAHRIAIFFAKQHATDHVIFQSWAQHDNEITPQTCPQVRNGTIYFQPTPWFLGVMTVSSSANILLRALER